MIVYKQTTSFRPYFFPNLLLLSFGVLSGHLAGANEYLYGCNSHHSASKAEARRDAAAAPFRRQDFYGLRWRHGRVL